MADNRSNRSEAPVIPKPARARRSPNRRLASKLLGLVGESFPKLTAVLKLARDWTRRKPLWIRASLYTALTFGALLYFAGPKVADLFGFDDVRENLLEEVKDRFAIGIPKAR
jgi:hypothetical protein